MNEQGRVDITLRFLNGPLAWQADVTRRGPTIRIGANPGPEGLKLEGYRGIDDRHAVITAYTEAGVQIAPVGPNQVRVAEHEHVQWGEVHPIRGPVYLSTGCAVHLGPVGRGATLTFVKAEGLAAGWRGGAVISEAAQADEGAASQVKELDTRKGVPTWFIPAFLLLSSTFMAVGAVLVFLIQSRVPESLGPIVEDELPAFDDVEESYGQIFEVKFDTALSDGLYQAYSNFVMKPNLDKAPALAASYGNSSKWDKNFIEYVGRAEKAYLNNWNFWKDLERAKGDYEIALRGMRNAGLPDVLAAIPYQESRYNHLAWDGLLCAAGLWQFQPETAKRYAIQVSGCPFYTNPNANWAPSLLAPPRNAIKNAEYVNDGHCNIKKSSCTVDQRTDVTLSTSGAVKMLGETWNDAELAASGAVVQATIASHNCGYDDSRYRNGQVSTTNIKHAYPAYRKRSGKPNGVTMFGDSIQCSKKSDMKEFDRDNINNTCGSVLPNVTQTYVPQVVAYHILAACYYGKNYADRDVFTDYRRFNNTGGYCTQMRIPTADQVRNHKAKK